jgi:hypothetical protein
MSVKADPAQSDRKVLERIAAELSRTRERVEAQSRRAEALERSLAVTRESAGVQPAVINAFEPLPPAASRAQLNSAAVQTDRRRAALAPKNRDDWWPVGARPKRPLVPNAGWRNFSLQGKTDKVIGVSVCGLPREGVERAIALVAAQQTAQRDFVPVFVTDLPDFEVFREHGYVFEYFPAAARRGRPDDAQDWERYAAERRALITQKWGIDRVVSFGPGDTAASAELSAAEPTPEAPPAFSETAGAAAPARQNSGVEDA